MFVFEMTQTGDQRNSTLHCYLTIWKISFILVMLNLSYHVSADVNVTENNPKLCENLPLQATEKVRVIDEK